MPTSGARHVLAFDSPQFVAHRRRFARLRYIVWGCAGYQGNCDIDGDLVSPVGFSNREEARQCAAAMTAACEGHCDSSAETINETPGLEWDGAESYYVATLTLPSALNWDGGDAFGAVVADLLRRGVDDPEADLLRRGVDDPEEAGELDVNGAAYDGQGSGWYGDEAASDYIASLLADQ